MVKSSSTSVVDDDDLVPEDDAQCIEKLLESYTRTGNDLGSRNTDHLIINTLRCELAQHFDFTCLICIDKINKTAPIWNCRSCRSVYHLQCVCQWANESLQKCILDEDNAQNHTADEARKLKSKAHWCCPKCRLQYEYREVPSNYRCFCGKVVNPATDAWLPPHSCGFMCKRSLSCGHHCVMLCHPGPCPPCPKIVETSCFCGQSTTKALRCYDAKWSCQKKCQKILQCDKHRCGLLCHEGPCETCHEMFYRPCSCGKKLAERPCAEISWSCQEMCGKILPCEKHHCIQICHSGPCAPCAESNALRCPCGKTAYEYGDCIDDLKCCGDTCGKSLDCGLHFCVERCHRGPCGTCNQVLNKRCRCGAKEKQFSCGKEFLCEIKCKNKRPCNKHACNRKCCSGYGSSECSPPCEQICGRALQCGNHKCNQLCHRGPCYPCTMSAEVKCRCGATVIKVPCGRERQTKPPRCLKMCQVPPVCQHTSREPHKCHFGDCPSCRQKCDLLLPCGHKCQQICHKGLLVDVNESSNNKKATTPWDTRRSIKLELVDEPCPPCQWPVPLGCLGAHVVEPTPCCRASRPFDCGRTCGRALYCGNHRCSLPCHAPLPSLGGVKGQPCEVCDKKCELPRPDGCSHTCSLPCHPAPCPECRLMVKVLCHCKLNEKLIPCLDWRRANEQQRFEMSSCGNQCPKLMTCGHPCTFTCHLGDCSSAAQCKKRVQIKCKCGGKSTKFLCCQKPQQNKLSCDAECQIAQIERFDDMAKTQNGDGPINLDEELNSNAPLTRRRRKKKIRELGYDSTSWFSNHKRFLIIASLIAVFGVLLYYAVDLVVL